MAVKVKNVMVGLSALGLLISIYLTAYHYAGVPLVCSDQGVINCANVLNSPYAVLFGVPIAVLGLVFFLAEILVILKFKNKDWVVLYNTVGIGFVIYYIYTEYLVGSVCIYCTAVHLITLALLIFSFSENEKIVL